MQFNYQQRYLNNHISGNCDGRVANSLDNIQKSFVVTMGSQNSNLKNGALVTA